jgi:hypothetical protein
MDDQSSVESCRWARLTIQLPYPVWLDSEDTPWTCLHDKEPRPLEDTAVCRGCPRWERRRVHVAEFQR